MSTFATFITRVRRELEEASASTWSDDSLLAWGNDSITDYAMKVKPLAGEDYTSSVAGQGSYELPSGVIETLSVAYDTAMLSKVTIDEMATLIVTSTTLGTPNCYSMMDGALYLNPTPDTTAKTIRFFFRYAPDAYATVTATAPMPWGGTHDAALSEYVLSKAYSQIQDFESASFHKGLYDAETMEALHERSVADDGGGFTGTRNVY
jgi:hypothetical protein